LKSYLFRRRSLLAGLLVVSISWFVITLTAETQSADRPVKSSKKPEPETPKIAGPSNEGGRAIAGFRVPAGIKAEVIASEPLLANPVAFCIDEQGRFYVCETFRQQNGVEDNRSHMNWLHDDLAAQTVEDRVKYFKKFLGKNISKYTKQDDRIRLLQDTTGDGKLDKATVFASGFNGIAEGTGAGVLAYRGNVFYTCIPKLWKLRDSDEDGVADDRRALHSGYGVRVAFRGHDMHGLTIGPDGRLYFSIGDRGYNVVTKEGKRLKRPDTGAVFRCELDGSQLEVFAYGLRNPQELAFDDYGNLFTGDNNCDSGDKARWVYVIQGGDTGWRMYYQYLKDRGPWNREMIWYPKDTPALKRNGPGGTPAGSLAAVKQPAAIIPPVANLADGPSGLTYYPGVGLSKRYNNHFFLADFRGNAGRSGIRSFAVQPKGASFEVVDSHQFLWKILATDVDFGYDGNLYATDWVSGWNGPGKGRIYRFSDPKHTAASGKNSAVALMKGGFAKLSTTDLVKHLEHADRRIRQEAQFELAGRKSEKELHDVVANGKHKLARIHALWGLAQILRKTKSRTLPPLSKLATDSDSEIRSQTMKYIGEALPYFSLSKNHGLLIELLLKGLKDKNPRVRYFAANGLSNSKQSKHFEPLAKLLVENAGKDSNLRHAGVMGFTGIGRLHPDHLQKLASHPHTSVRMAALLAWRRLARERYRVYEDTKQKPAYAHFRAASNNVASYLHDIEPNIVLEAARGFDEIDDIVAMHQLASLANQPESAGMSPALLRRVMNACLRGGSAENATALARLAANSRVPEKLRLEAIHNLQNWNNPPPLDRVSGKWRPINKRKPVELASLIKPSLGGILSGPNSIRQAGTQLAAKLGIKEVGPLLYELFTNRSQSSDVRVEALRALFALKSDKLAIATNAALTDDRAIVRAEGLKLFARLKPQQAFPLAVTAIIKGDTVEKQAAVAVLASFKSQSADNLLRDLLQKIKGGKVPPEIHLDVIQAVQQRKSRAMKQAAEQFEASRSKTDHLAKYRESLSGGNANRGREIFFNRTAVSCRRCHKIQKTGGEVGPDLSGVGKQKKRDYILESLVLPNKQIAKGFDSITFAMENGKVYSGIVKADDGKTIRLILPTGQIISLKKEEIDDQAKGKSAMPEDLIKHLSKSDIRDLVEYLSDLKTPVKPSKP
jgi:quinoprotein glucose dehydrogenase